MIALGQKCTLSLETLPLSAPVLEAHLFVLHRHQEFFFSRNQGYRETEGGSWGNVKEAGDLISFDINCV